MSMRDSSFLTQNSHLLRLVCLGTIQSPRFYRLLDRRFVSLQYHVTILSVSMQKFLKHTNQQMHSKELLFASSTNSLSDRPSFNRYNSFVIVVPVMVMNKSGRVFAKQTAISPTIFEPSIFFEKFYRVIITLRVGSFAMTIT